MWEDKAFWNIVEKKNKNGNFFSKKQFLDPETVNDKFNLLEVMVVAALARKSDQFDWRATRASKDNGIDFYAVFPSYDFPSINFAIKTIAIGQIKRESSARQEELVRDTVGPIRKIEWKKTEAVAVVYLLIGGTAWNDKKLINLRRNFSDPTINLGGPGKILVVDLKEILHLMAINRDYVVAALEGAITDNEREIIYRYLNSLVDEISPNAVEIAATVPSVAETGKPIMIRLAIKSESPLLHKNLTLTYSSTPDVSSNVEILSPIDITKPGGFKVIVDGDGTKHLELYLRCFQTGCIPLGTLHVYDEFSRKVGTQSLPSIELAFSFSLQFFDKPNADLILAGSSTMLAMIHGKPGAMIITGGGGAGKSNICAHLLEKARNLDAHVISVEHANSSEKRGQLMQATIKCLADIQNTSTLDENWLQNVLFNQYPAMPADAKVAYQQLFSEQISSNLVGLTKGLLVQIITRIKSAPLVLYWRDLHWADEETLAIIESLWENLAYEQADERGMRRVFLLLEGRDKDSLATHYGQFKMPVHWQKFLLATAIKEKLQIRAWTPEEGRAFLDAIVTTNEAKNSFGGKLQTAPQVAALIDHVMKNASGNPMHIVEQLKWLHAQKIIAHTKTGMIYVNGSLNVAQDVPQELGELIQLRIEFFRAGHEKIIDLLILLAKIGREIPGLLFMRLVNANVDSRTLQIIKQMEVMETSDERGARFLHENYFRCFRNLAPSAVPLGLDVATKWFRDLPKPSLSDQCCLIRLLLQDENPAMGEIIQRLVTGIQAATRVDAQMALSELLETAFSLGPSLLKSYGVDVLYLRLLAISVKARIEHADNALAAVKELDQECEQNSDYRAAIQYRAKSKALAADILLGMMKYSEGLDAVGQGLALVGRATDTQNNPALAQIHAELLHRQAVLLWFCGQAKAAVSLQFQAARICRKACVIAEEVVSLRELGTNLLHRSPSLGIQILDAAHGKFKNCQESIPRTEENIILAQKMIGELLIAQFQPSDIILEIAYRAADLFHRCYSGVDIYDAVRCGLVCGAAHALCREFGNAAIWFGRASALANRAGLLEDLWMARLNLAIIAAQTDAPSEVALNGQLAFEHLARSLQNGSDEMLHARAKLIMLPLLHLKRLKQITDAEISQTTRSTLPDWGNTWVNRPPAVCRNMVKQQALHVRRGDFDYFLMN